jgi:hypothetical protein
MATDDKDIAEALNKFFASVFTREDLGNIPSKPKETNSSLNTIHIMAGNCQKDQEFEGRLRGRPGQRKP